MLDFLGSVDVHGLTAGTDAGEKPWEGTGAGGLPEGVSVGVSRLTSGGNGAPKARIFEAGGAGLVRAVMVSKAGKRIGSFPLKAPHYIKDVALL